ncbi:MAG: Fic family protein [Alphaproteobacteria bacterium]|jgi:cell filamentation protein|nr:Fic family protein [Alphaproteobacteria bacterium]
MRSGEGILNNYFGITDRNQLNKIEFEFVRKRLREIQSKPIPKNFDIKYLLGIHKHLFQDVYPWAGTLREGGFSSKNRVLDNGESHIVEYSFSDYLEYNLTKELEKIKEAKYFKNSKGKEEFCNKIGDLYKELDFLHPFAEGNSRTLREFTRQIGINTGYEIMWEKTYAIKDELYIARDLGVNNNDGSKLIKILNDITEPSKFKVISKQKDTER